MGVRDRLAREADARREAKKCPPHPPNRQLWQTGDYSIPDRLVCGRCGALLASRKHHGPVRATR